jgi:hypothetical protein
MGAYSRHVFGTRLQILPDREEERKPTVLLYEVGGGRSRLIHLA